MNETITLRYDNPTCGNNGNISDCIQMKFESEGMTIYDLADRLKQFCLAIGYQPSSVDEVFRDYDG
jgi:hypothetical protein